MLSSPYSRPRPLPPSWALVEVGIYLLDIPIYIFYSLSYGKVLI